MIKITRNQLENENILDLDAEVALFAKAREEHRLTVNVPAPTAPPLVEAVFWSGGYELLEEPEPEENELESEVVESDPAALLTELRALVARAELIVASLPKFEPKLE